jgi:RimJ/RimL family protein N-acetyltransferase
MTGQIYNFKRLTLRTAIEDDLERIIDMERADDNIPHIRQWSFEQHRNAIHDDNIAHMMVMKKETEEIIGYIILPGLKNPDRSLEFKRMVITQKNQGYGRETFQFVKKLIFEDYNFHRIWLEVMDTNKPGFHLYESEGFKVEGTLRDALKMGGVYHNLIVMSMLEQEYSNQ